MKQGGRVWWIVGLVWAGAVGCSAEESQQGQAGNNASGCQGASCDDAGEDDAGDDDVGGLGENNPEPEPMCPAEGWEPGKAAFREASAEWGLVELGAQGVRINATDLDGDGWPDLVIRRGGDAPDDFNEGGTRQTWVLRNTGQGKFEDITASSGLRALRGRGPAGTGRPGEVWAFGDVDNDGDMDAFTGTNTTDGPPNLTETSEVMLNQGDGTFALAPFDTDLRRPDDAVGGATFVDADRDGKLDLWVGNGNPANGDQPLPDRLYKGDGEGRFVEVGPAWGVASRDWTLDNLNQGLAHTVAWSTAACDLDNDGWPELLAASYGRAPNHLWTAAGSRGPRPTYQSAGVASGYAFDPRQDWTDNQSARCYCKLNPDAPDCEGVPAPNLIRCTTNTDAFRWNHVNDREPFRLGGNSGTTVCADVNNDGWLDLLTTEIVHWDVGSSSDPSELLFNQQESPPRFERPGNEATGLTRDRAIPDWNDGDITTAVFDFDNDGWPDLYLGSTDYPGTHGLLYHQASPEKFQPVPIEDGIDHHRSHGIAVADFDRDGDLDVVVGHSRGRCGPPDDCYPTSQVRLFENVIGQDNPWLQLTLEGGPNTNRAAIGARVQVTALGVTQTQEVDGGHGHYGIQREPTLHFGLGHGCRAQVTVRWPDANLTEETWTLDAGRRYQLKQGQEPVAVE